MRTLLQQRGQIQRISRAVDCIHQNLDKPLSELPPSNTLQ
jgi:hypothetical protein